MYPVGPVRQPYARAGYIPQSGTKNLATACIYCIPGGIYKGKLLRKSIGRSISNVAGALCTVLDEYWFLDNLLFGVLIYITPHKKSV
jgi:hypothetical protein